VLLAINVPEIVSGIEKLFHVKFLNAQTYYISELPSELLWSDVWATAGMAFLLSLLATIYPAWQAAKINPAEVLRYE
jgi:lipoprotein-releasing system permease protein